MKKIFFGKRGFDVYFICGLVFLICNLPWIVGEMIVEKVPMIGWPAFLFLHYLIGLFILFLYWLFIRFVIISPILWIVEKFNKRG